MSSSSEASSSLPISTQVLGQVALGYSPFIGRQREVLATRITVAPVRPDVKPDAAALLAALQSVWPAPPGSAVAWIGDPSGGSAQAQARADEEEPPLELTLRTVETDGKRGPTTRSQSLATAAPARSPAPSARGPLPLAPVSLNIADEALLAAVLEAPLPLHFMIEVPAFMAADAGHARHLQALAASGVQLLLKGRPLQPLGAELLACFSHAVVETEEERRALPAAVPGTRKLGLVQSGVRTTLAAGQAFERDAMAVLGWPLDDALPTSLAAGGKRVNVPPDVQVVLELINGVDRDWPAPKLEALLKREPTLAFRLMRYLNSPAFGLSVEINSFGHALMLLGSQRLKRWLALLLASACKGSNAQPLMHAAVRRGLLMEEIARGQGDAELRGQMFICGVFSLLDRLLQQPFEDMLSNLPVPETVQQALLGGGPLAPYLALVEAVESESAYDLRQAADHLMLSIAEVNQAFLSAMKTGRQLDG